MDSLRKKTVSGFKWVALSNYSQKALSFLTFIVLARLLEPTVFGIFSMAFIIIDGLALFKDMGLDSAFIQRKERIEEAAHTMFWMMPVIGVVIYGLLFFIAPLASVALKETDLTAIIRTIGLVFVLGSFENVPLAKLKKELRFKQLAIREFISAFLYSLSAVILAFAGLGVWSLVYAYIVKRVSMLGMTWVISDFKPRWTFDKPLAKEMLHYGKFIFGSSLILFSIYNIDNFIIGRMLGAAVLGYYALAFNIASVTVNQLTMLINRVMFPAYSKIQGDRERIKKITLKITKAISIFAFPLGITLFLAAEKIVPVLYGNKWLPMVPPLKVLSLCTMFLPFVSVSASVLRAGNRPKWEFVTGIITIVLMAVSLPFMIMKFQLLGAAIAVTFSRIIFIPISLFLLKKLIGLRFSEISRELKSAFISSAILAIFIMLAKPLVVFEASRSLASIMHLSAFLGGLCVIYFGVFYLLDKRALREIYLTLLGKEQT